MNSHNHYITEVEIMDKIKVKMEPTDPEDKRILPDIEVFIEEGKPVMIHAEEEGGKHSFMETKEDQNGAFLFTNEPSQEDAVTLLNNPELYHLVDPFKEGSMDPDQPEIEARLKKLGILRKVGNRYLVDERGFAIAWYFWVRGKGEITPQEYAYSIFLKQHQTKKKRSEVDCIYFKSALGTLIFRTTLKPRIQRAKKPQAPIKKHRAGKHFIDNILKSNKPEDPQLSWLDNLRPETLDKIITSGATADLVNRKGEGIKLSKGEYKLALCLSKLLHDKSQTTNKKGLDYYTGNREVKIAVFKTDKGEDIELKSPTISFTLYEIAKEFYGGGDIGGENVKIVARLLNDLSEDPSKRALIRYHKRIDLGGGREREYFIERYDSLVKIDTIGFKDLLEGKQIDEQREIVVTLHPVYIDSIEKISIEIPTIKGIIEAYGSPNISEITQKLTLELARAHSNKRKLPKDSDNNPIYTIGQNNLYWKIAESYMNPKTGRALRPQLIKEYFDKSIETVKTLGLLLKWESKKGATGEPLFVFTLSKDW